jgi:lipopolysaccharide export system protein LptA
MRKLLIAALLLAPATAHAQALKNHDSNAPVDVAADRIEVQDRANRAVFAGNVHVEQAGMTMDAQRLTVAYAGTASGGNPDIQRLDATGGVTVKKADQTARGNSAIYDLNRRIITMLGGVTLNQGGNVVRGGRLVIDLNSGRSVVDGSAAGGATVTGKGGRVTGRFTVPQRQSQPN